MMENCKTLQDYGFEEVEIKSELPEANEYMVSSSKHVDTETGYSDFLRRVYGEFFQTYGYQNRVP